MRSSIIGFTRAPAASRVVHELVGVDRLTSTHEKRQFGAVEIGQRRSARIGGL
jgi:hypothetical protein